MKIKTIRVSDKGQIAIPSDIRKDIGIKRGDNLIIIQEGERIMIEKVSEISKSVKDNFKDLLRHSKKVAKKFWENEADDIWDKV